MTLDSPPLGAFSKPDLHLLVKIFGSRPPAGWPSLYGKLAQQIERALDGWPDPVYLRVSLGGLSRKDFFVLLAHLADFCDLLQDIERPGAGFIVKQVYLTVLRAARARAADDPAFYAMIRKGLGLDLLARDKITLNRLDGLA